MDPISRGRFLLWRLKLQRVFPRNWEVWLIGSGIEIGGVFEFVGYCADWV